MSILIQASTFRKETVAKISILSYSMILQSKKGKRKGVKTYRTGSNAKSKSNSQ
jgi:hypothetical protein